MRNICMFLAGIGIFLVSCQSEKKEKEEITIGTEKKEIAPVDLGKKIFNTKGKCYTCHKTNKKSIGPSVVDIVKIYNDQNADLIAFLKQEADPIVDPENYAVMKTNFALIKNFTLEELEALKIYMEEIGSAPDTK
ncbi:c-type cytochrome [Aquimarina pacifica]|uniref:c-type cytochrome n=1 Tax=Aquimarina pacifica TaxID=1296415 RepID=UPI000471744C|nr:c-type cytochrome [Aquimarina pacifica]